MYAGQQIQKLSLYTVRHHALPYTSNPTGFQQTLGTRLPDWKQAVLGLCVWTEVASRGAFATMSSLP